MKNPMRPTQPSKGGSSPERQVRDWQRVYNLLADLREAMMNLDIHGRDYRDATAAAQARAHLKTHWDNVDKLYIDTMEMVCVWDDLNHKPSA